MKRIFLAILLMSLLLTACAAGAKDAVPEENYPVYDLILKANQTFSTSEDFVVRGQSGPLLTGITAADFYTSLSKELGDLQEETAASFIAANQQAHTLENKFDPALKVTLLSEKDISKLLGSYPFNWEAFSQKYPSAAGVMRLSNAGVNAAGDQALVYTAQEMKTGAYETVFFLLNKVDGEWKIKEFTPLALD